MKFNQKGFAEWVIVGILFIVSLTFVIKTCPYEKEIRVKGFEDTIYTKHYSPGELMTEHWFEVKVQDTTKKMLDKHFPDKHKVFMYGAWHVFLDEKYKMCACDPEGKYLYIVGKKAKNLDRPKKKKSDTPMWKNEPIIPTTEFEI